MALKAKLLKVLSRIRGAFPSRVPTGVTEFNIWAASIINTYNPPGDERSIKFGLCAMLMRLNPTEAYKSKRFFFLCLAKGASAQVAAYIMEDIKKTQALEWEKQQAEATAAQEALDAAKKVDSSGTI